MSDHFSRWLAKEAGRGEWHPECTRPERERIPQVGWLIGQDHAVWEITEVRNVKMTTEDLEHWARFGARQVETWHRRPFRVKVRWVGGVKPEWVTGDHDEGSIVIRPDHYTRWEVYPGGRWPKCSCCGEPMPCRASINDAVVDVTMERVNEMESRLPGHCWACGEQTTRRHKTVRYVGENLDLPGGPPVVFHVRASCYDQAAAYETRWIAADTSRRRIITWPYCPGLLIHHHDGSTECHGGDSDCRGKETHDHGSGTTCYSSGRTMSCSCPRSGWGYGGLNPRRPVYRNPDDPQGQPGGQREAWARIADERERDASDGRPACPGTLIVHADGTAECRAGGLDDCWDGSKYRHALKRDCASLTHGCPKCETTEGLA